MRQIPILIFIVLLLAGFASAVPTAYFTSPTPASGILTNQTLQVSFNFSPSNISSCKVQIQNVNYTGNVSSGSVCSGAYTMPLYANVSVLGWATVSNSTFRYYQLTADSYLNMTDTPVNTTCNYAARPCGVWANFPNFHDGNWSTSSQPVLETANGVYPTDWADINFTPPVGVMSGTDGTVFMYGDGNSPPIESATFINFGGIQSTSYKCLQQSVVQIRISFPSSGSSSVQCYNGSAWVWTQGGAPYSQIWETAMNWSINTTNTSVAYATNETRMFCYPNCTSTTPPTITLISPINNNYTNNDNISFTFMASDAAGGNLSCSLYIDGMGPPQTNTSVQENTTTALTEYGIAQGPHHWNINCTDTSNNSALSQTWNFTVDSTPPIVSLNYPANSAVFNASTFNFSFTATSAYSPTLSCYLYIDGTIAGSGSVSANATTMFPAPYLAGTHNWQVYCGDLAGNTNSSPIWNFAITQVITPVIPPNNGIVSGSNVNLRYSFYTASPANMTCTVYVDGTLVSNATTSVPGGLTTQNLWVPADNGTHIWNVVCIDDNTNGTIVMPPSNFTIGAGIWGDITYVLVPNTNFVNTSTNVTFMIASNLSKLDYYGMNITFYNASTGNISQVFYQNVSNASGGGTLQYAMNSNGTYRILAFFSEAGQLFVMPWVIQYGSNEGINAIAIQMQNNPPLSGFGWYFLALCVAMVVAGFVSKYTIGGAGFAALGVLWIFSLLYIGVPVVTLGTQPLDGVAITTFATVMVFAGAYLGWYG